jgi:predicted anti-sigma-YlaC factor YlaD
MSPPARLGVALLVATLASGCSLKRLALGSVASSLAESSATLAREDDPELVRETLPVVMKAMEGVLIGSPDEPALRLATCQAFALYASGFLEADAERLATNDYEASEALRLRAIALHLRARDHALHALELAHPGLGERLRLDPPAAALELTVEDVEAAYLTGGTWGLAIALGKDQAELVADVDAVRALLRRALELDESFQAGAIHEALIAVEALPEMMGGSPTRAREHYARARELSGGTRASVHVALAASVCVSAQLRAEFEELLALALAVDLAADPDQRLANRLAQARARRLLARIDELFLPPLE